MILRTVGSLAAVLALIYGLSWAAKRFIKPELFAGGAAKIVKVLHSMPIESKKRLLIIEVGSRQLLLGVSEGSISYLCDVNANVKMNNEERPHVASSL
jgi:flagellar protein FliO/FliZ